MPDEEPRPDFTRAHVGIVHATAMEVRPFLNRFDRLRKYSGGKLVFRGGLFGDVRIALAQSGMGPVAARRATRALIDGHAPDWIISAGFSGALQSQMKIGDIVVGNSIVDRAGTELTIDLKMEANPASGLYVGRLLMVDRIVPTVAEKKALAQDRAAIAVDMESLAVAQVCRESKVRFMAVRVISDDLSADLPSEILSVVGSSGTVRLGAAVGAIFKRPGSAKDMWRLREQGMDAADRLATFLEGVVEQLYESLPKQEI
jgi:adenosylhomocysteine nucleosidase